MRAPAWVVFFVALLLRLLPIDHGLPGLYVPDTHSVRNALGMLKDKNPVPRSNQYSSYPYLYSYLCIPLFAADYAAARVSGRAKNSAEYQQWAGAHLDHYHHLARFVSAFAGAGAAAAAVFVGFLLAGRRAGLFAGILAASSPLFLLLSTHERPWSCVLAFSNIAAAFALLAIRAPSLKYIILSAAAAGASAGCHQLGAGSVIFPAAAAWFAFEGMGAAAIRKSFLFGAAALLAFIVVFLAGNPYYLIYGLKGAVSTNLTESTDVSVGGQGLKFVFDAKYTSEALLGLFSMEGIVCMLGIAGAWICIKSKDRAAFVLLAFAAPITLFFLLYTGTHARYFIIAFPAAWAFGGALLARASSKSLIFASSAILLIPLILSFRLDYLLYQEDTRNLAASELEHRIAPHARILLEPYGPALRPDTASLENFIKLASENGADPLTRRERLVLDRRLEGGFDILPLERYFSDAAAGQYTTITAIAKKTAPGAKTPAEFLTEVKGAYAVRVDRFPSAARRDPFVDFLQQKGTLMFEWSPAAGSTPPEALLPFEPRLGAYSLFTVERPGPRVQLYQIK